MSRFLQGKSGKAQLTPSAPQGGSAPSERRPSWVKELLEWVKMVAAALVIVLLLHVFVFNLSTVVGHSMEPTLKEREWLFVNKLALRLGKPRLGDIVVLKDVSTPSGPQSYLVKRVVGVPGDRIEIRSGKLYRNGAPAAEPYTDSDIDDADYGPVVVEPGRYFVMGDNRHTGASRDSRSFGTVPGSQIEGRADLILWPVRQLKAL
ncbi:signal peptidase I [Paenibacillus beijingensis]|uniref:Signal peptidase I n=1 Tax=Paenibacillus beijingensis TaxID=1126833 RepID=A0A0D5NGA0_9BACL|nr:signal peptidase I [Paenibacillus beijingensis]AJY74419.1 signal peptidase I [Paenibacillus beijingensis]